MTILVGVLQTKQSILCMVSGIPAAMRALWPPFMEPHGAPGEISPALSPHVRLRVADIYTSHRREPQVEVDLLSTFDGLPLQRCPIAWECLG